MFVKIIDSNDRLGLREGDIYKATRDGCNNVVLTKKLYAEGKVRIKLDDNTVMRVECMPVSDIAKVVALHVGDIELDVPVHQGSKSVWIAPKNHPLISSITYSLFYNPEPNLGTDIRFCLSNRSKLTPAIMKMFNMVDKSSNMYYRFYGSFRVKYFEIFVEELIGLLDEIEKGEY